MIAGPGNVDETKRERWPIAYGTSVHAKWHATYARRRNASTTANQVSAEVEPNGPPQTRNGSEMGAFPRT
jgi:hypothetical protein